MLDHLSSDIDPNKLDHESFKFTHDFVEHEALSLQNLSDVLVNLPQDQVMYSKTLSDLNSNFDRAHLDHRNNLSIEETIENIRTSDSYIMVRSPEDHPSFKELYSLLLEDVNKIIRAKGVGTNAINPMLYLFIASPGASTPFHIDRYSTFLMQFRGSKMVAVFPQFDENIVPAVISENFVDYGPQRPEWSERIDSNATKFHFMPGEAIHIPFSAGHYIENGTEDVSISMSIIFRTNESQRWMDAMRVNNRLRKQLNLSVTPVGRAKTKDSIKARMFPFFEYASHLKHGRK